MNSLILFLISYASCVGTISASRLMPTDERAQELSIPNYPYLEPISRGKGWVRYEMVVSVQQVGGVGVHSAAWVTVSRHARSCAMHSGCPRLFPAARDLGKWHFESSDPSGDRV